MDFFEIGQQHNRMKGKNMANLIIVCGPQAVGKNDGSRESER